MSDEPTFRRLASLLAPAVSSDVWRPQDFAAILRHQLDSMIGTRGPTFRDVLSDPQPDRSLLNQIKEFAKVARNDPGSGVPPEVCHVLYYAAITVAGLRREGWLTSLDDPALRRGIEWALGLPWLDDQLRPMLQAGLQMIK